MTHPLIVHTPTKEDYGSMKKKCLQLFDSFQEDVAAVNNKHLQLIREAMEESVNKITPMRTNEITKENPRVGDVIERDDKSLRIILEIGQNSFLPSNSRWGKYTDGEWWTFFEARESGWTIKLSPEEEPPRKVTMAEVRAQMGNVEIVEE